ncbi:MAG: dTMP kinase [Nevskiales bacterium]|nr:dTMP kinase [Nevskiales bacterium]
MTRGRFIVFDGVEGSGKSTQMPRVARWIRDRHGEPVTTREPGGTALAEEIRRVALEDHDEPLPKTAELLLMFAARSVHLNNRIWPALQAGHWVLCDRFVDASFAYQGAGQGLPSHDIEQLEAMVVGTQQPDCVFLFDLPVEVLVQRVAQRGHADRFDRAETDFHARVRTMYLERAQRRPERYAIIDATASVESMTRTICDELERRFAG